MQPLFALTDKQQRVIRRCLQEVFSTRALEPIVGVLKLKFPEILTRCVKVTPSGSELLMSPQCAAAYERLRTTLVEAGASSDLFTEADLGSALKETYETSWQAQQAPDDPTDLVLMLSDRLLQKVRNQTIVAPLHGLNLVGVAEMPLGDLTLAASASDVVRKSGATLDLPLATGPTEGLLKAPCLVGTRRGTLDSVKRWYREQAYLVAGMLAAEAGANYDRAATSFCIEPGFERPTSRGSAVYLFWNEIDNHVGRTLTFRRGQLLELTQQRVAELTQPGAFEYAFRIFQKGSRNDLEEAIARAVYWYGDAHRDPVAVMQFVKYWACLECLLGGPGEKLTETLALGVVTVLTFGHYRLLAEPERENNARTVKRLYALRSKAVHRASHTHVVARDLILISQWAAWIIFNCISFSQSGMRERQALWRRITEIGRTDPEESPGTEDNKPDGAPHED